MIRCRKRIHIQTPERRFLQKEKEDGLGFRIGSYGDNNFKRHSGGYPGFVTDYLYYTGKDLTIIPLKNSGNYGEDVWPIGMGLSDIMFDRPYDLWKLRKPV
ncbi:MAG TPA: hypothetical protein VK664_16160 [Flavitalea sp.]|nr:hypothetical protein [Flavitalea sp.]